MRVVMTLLVRDELDIVAATIEHHLALGVDHIVITDNGSVDGTRDLLGAYSAAGGCTVIDEPAQDYEQARWVTRMARLAAVEYGADWVLNVDADEFWWPPDLDFIAVLGGLPASVGVGSVERFNLEDLPGTHGAWPERLLLRDELSLSTRGTRIAPKTAHRAHPEVEISQGNHFVLNADVGAPVALVGTQMLHVPIRSAAQYERKIANGGSSYAANTRLDATVGWHWREDHERLLAGTLGAALASRQLDANRVASRVADGTLVHDTRLRDRLRHLVRSAVLPDALRAVLTG